MKVKSIWESFCVVRELKVTLPCVKNKDTYQELAVSSAPGQGSNGAHADMRRNENFKKSIGNSSVLVVTPVTGCHYESQSVCRS